MKMKKHGLVNIFAVLALMFIVSTACKLIKTGGNENVSKGKEKIINDEPITTPKSGDYPQVPGIVTITQITENPDSGKTYVKYDFKPDNPEKLSKNLVTAEIIRTTKDDVEKNKIVVGGRYRTKVNGFFASEQTGLDVISLDKLEKID